ncbi:MAG: enoyl-CoA hydratase/isomerase family protein [Betaproteobacteria bacterium]|nr:enoyl-CoA hydratase/isomerase family protein [Betaproteobacteria bacterium]
MYSPLFGHPLLLLDLDQELPDDTDLQTLVAALATLPCPILGLGACITELPQTLLSALDVVLEDAKELPPLLRNIRAHPLAAATLVQLLRHNETASINAGLLAESLAFGMLQASADFRRHLETQPPPLPCNDTDPLKLDRVGSQLNITLTHAHRRNAWSATMRDSFYEALLLLASDPGIVRALVRGDGECFCTGGDLSEFGLAFDAAQAHLVRLSRPVSRLLAQLAPRMEFHVHRACIGSGIELPAFAGRLVASANTYFQLPEIGMGLIPGAGGTVSITRRIGRQRTAWLALSGTRIKAELALAWGLIDEIT